MGLYAPETPTTISNTHTIHTGGASHHSGQTLRLYAEALEEVRLQLADVRDQSAGHALPRIPRTYD